MHHKQMFIGHDPTGTRVLCQLRNSYLTKLSLRQNLKSEERINRRKDHYNIGSSPVSSVLTCQIPGIIKRRLRS
jgi:hypothetical protein